jgi:histidyl-tRNA synthetase
VSERDQEKAAKRAQWEEINRAKALAKQKQAEESAQAPTRAPQPKKQFQTITGARDLLPPDTVLWNRVEQVARAVFETFGLTEIRLPILESTELFSRAVGDETDIVSKEMYTLVDKAPGLPEASDFSVAPRVHVELHERAIKTGEISANALNEASMARLKALVEIYSAGIEHGSVEQAEMTYRVRASGLQFGESITLRPEATASVCRAYIEHNMQQLPQPVKLYYMGPMFRRERPQKGRYRQFYQIGAEVLGGNDAPAIDAEVIEMVMTFFDKLELPGVQLDINSIGHNAPDCRPKYVELLRDELRKVKDQLGEDSQRRIETNPLRVLDSKLESEQAIIAKLPHIADHLCDGCATHYSDVKNQLQLRGVIYRENWRLVRGLDYYMRTTFEITAKGLGSQNAVCGGGRYDGLVELLGGPPTKGIGFAIGQDRLILSLQDAGKIPAQQGRDVYIAWMGEHAYAAAVRAAKVLRNAGLSVELPPTEQKFGKALERASKLDSRYALIIGDNEVSEGVFTLKTLADGTQEKYTEPELLERLMPGESKL